MKERPILFSAPMVRAILEGRKTQTRRIMHSNQPPVDAVQLIGADNKPTGEFGICLEHKRVIDKHITCPLGNIGDQLWVRETCQANMDTSDSVILSKYSADGASVLYPGKEIDINGDPHYGGTCAHWWYSRTSCPSIHMPRWASRIQLEIAGARVERLTDISRGAAMEEGCPFPNMAKGDNPKIWFKELWSSIKGAESWNSNPWVWVIDFERIRP